MEVIVTPAWRGVLKPILVLLECGSAEGKKIAIEELERMADLADRYVALQEKTK